MADILMFRCRKGGEYHRAAYCTECCSFFCTQTIPYGTEWSMLQKLDWAQDCDRHRRLCEARFTTEAYRDAPTKTPAPPGAAPDTASRPTAPDNCGREVGL